MLEQLAASKRGAVYVRTGRDRGGRRRSTARLATGAPVVVNPVAVRFVLATAFGFAQVPQGRYNKVS